jgi:2-oxoglutarate ferredoxin oxidoreductase subunit gamma
MLIKIIFSGFGGQGVLMMGYILAVSAMREGKHVTYLPSYGAEVRGGTANKPSLIRYEAQIKQKGTLLLNSDLIDVEPTRKDIEVFKVPANTLAKKLKSERTINMIMLGALAAATEISSIDSLMNGLTEVVKAKTTKQMELNRKGLEMGAAYILNGE